MYLSVKFALLITGTCLIILQVNGKFLKTKLNTQDIVSKINIHQTKYINAD